MKRLFSLVIVFILLFFAVGCSQLGKEESVRPPVRIAPGAMLMQLQERYTVASAFEQADAVVRVKIGSWLGENTEAHKTYFETSVLECFKGNIPTKFTLMQDGCSTVTQEGYPLFTAGNELLLFLYEATNFQDYESAYWIAGAFTTIMDVAYDADGNRYYADRYGIFCENFFGCLNYTAYTTVEEELVIEKSLRAYLNRVDPFFETMGYRFPYIYRGDAFEDYLKGL